MTFSRVVLAGVLAVLGVGGLPRAALAKETIVQSTEEVGIPDDGGRMLLIHGVNLSKATFELDEANGTPIGAMTPVFLGKTLAAVRIPAALVSPTYTIPGDFNLKVTTTAGSDSVGIHLTGGIPENGSVPAAALAPALRTDLDDAATLGGEAASQFHDAAGLTGTVSTDRFSAYDDLAAESRIGTSATQVAAGNHNHDAIYPLRTELTNSAGSVNALGNPVDWSQIKGIPGGIADGVDSGGASYLAGTGLTLTVDTFSVNFGVGGSASTASRSDHDHNTLYYTQAQLNATGGSINAAANPVDWSRIKGMPAGFADGTDDSTSYTAGNGLTLTGTVFSANFAGNGSNLTLSRSDHDHNTVYYTQTQLNATGGTVNSVSNPVDWSRLKGVPAGFADGTDDNVTLAGSGSATTASRSDHSHSTYLLKAGGETVTGTMTFSTSGDSIVATSGNTQVAGPGGIDCTASGGTAIAGHGDYAVIGDLDSDGQFGVMGISRYSYQTGVYGYARYATSYAVDAYNKSKGGTALRASAPYYGGRGIYATAYRGVGIQTYCYGGIGLKTYTFGKATGLQVNGGYNTTMAVFIRYGSNVARIDQYGRGYFNGGTYNGGADFAESVKVNRPVEEFEPGDVLVIDVAGKRRFALSREANSTLVAGVVSTKPAVVGTTHDVARNGSLKAMMKEEVKLGIVGIVPTKVCDEGGAIRAGDLLVSASLPGHAKKAPPNPAVGTVLGKALDALDQGTGKIEVLLMAR